MTPYKQSDIRWGKETIGSTKLTLAKWGCLITSLASIIDKTPKEVNKILKLSGSITKDGMVIHNIASKALNLTYNGFSTVPSGICIGCTNNYARHGIFTHFFVWLDKNSEIMDPIVGKVIKNPYKIQSYRLYGFRHN